MYVKDVEETTVTHQQTQADHVAIGRCSCLVLQILNRSTETVTHSLHLGKVQQTVAHGLSLTLIEVYGAPGLENAFNVIAQRLSHALTYAIAKQEGDGEHENGKDGLKRHEHMTPTLTYTTTKRATHNVDGLVAAEHRCGDET